MPESRAASALCLIPLKDCTPSCGRCCKVRICGLFSRNTLSAQIFAYPNSHLARLQRGMWKACSVFFAPLRFYIKNGFSSSPAERASFFFAGILWRKLGFTWLLPAHCAGLFSFPEHLSKSKHCSTIWTKLPPCDNREIHFTWWYSAGFGDALSTGFWCFLILFHCAIIKSILKRILCWTLCFYRVDYGLFSF